MSPGARARPQPRPVHAPARGNPRPSFIKRFARHRAGLVGASIVGTLVALGILAPIIAPYDPLFADTSVVRQAPSSAHWLGTDQIGRDILSRILYGAQVTVRVSLLAVVVGALIGVSIGTLSGYAGGPVDLAVQRVIDSIQAFPGILLALLIAAVIGPSLEWSIAVLGVLAVPTYTRLVRGNVLLVRNLMYVEAARSLGCGSFRIVVRHVLPNSLSPVIVQSSLQAGSTLLLLASLGYLGLGVPVPTPEWGSMLGDGQTYLRTAPHIVIVPGIVISITVLGLNLLGDALRDALDPRAVYLTKR